LPEGPDGVVPEGWNDELIDASLAAGMGAVDGLSGGTPHVNSASDQRGLRPGIGGRVEPRQAHRPAAPRRSHCRQPEEPAREARLVALRRRLSLAPVADGTESLFRALRQTAADRRELAKMLYEGKVGRLQSHARRPRDERTATS
jgi:hypothetical protein